MEYEMKDNKKVKITEDSLSETKEWLNNSENKIPPSVFVVFTNLLNMYSVLASGIVKVKNIKNFLAQQMGIAKKSEKVGSQKEENKEIQQNQKRKLKRKKTRKIFKKTRAGQKHETLANNTPSHVAEPPQKTSVEKITTEKQHPIATDERGNSFDESNTNAVSENKTMRKDEIKIALPLTASDIYLVAEEKEFELRGTKNIKTGEINYEKHSQVAPGFSYTFRAIATLVTLHVGHQLPINRLADMVAIKGKNIAKSTIFSFIVHVAECFLPIFYVMLESLFSKADAINTDDTKEKTLRAEAEDLLCDETEIDSTPALGIARKVHDYIGLVSINEKQNPYKMNLTVCTGLLDQQIPSSRIVIKISHFGSAGHLMNRLIGKFRNEKIKPSLWIISDMLAANRPTKAIIETYKINFAGCGAHARRGIWKNRSLDDMLWAIIRGFKALSSLEEKIIRIGAGNNPEKILEWRRKYGKKIWKFIMRYCVKITKKWPKGTEPFNAADYILNNEYELKRYLGVWYLPFTNNIAERLLRPEKLMLASSKFRSNLGGRICYDIIASVMSTCLCANVNFISYTIDVLRNKSDVAINPAFWVPQTWNLRQQQSKK